jgi:ubiquinone/menaquinone biosynthesis C-methylase UbiE
LQSVKNYTIINEYIFGNAIKKKRLKKVMKRFETIRTYYESNMGKGLPEYSILGWESEDAQNLRFDILASSVELDGKRILDVGCGTGNLLGYLSQKNINVKYTGMDILSSMIEYAKGKKLNGDFYHVDIFKNNIFEKESFDIIYASGIFNLNLQNNAEFLSKALNVFIDLSKEAIVFNLLHIDSPSKENLYYYFSPDDVARILEPISKRLEKVNIIENYLQNDFTVICLKNNKGT